MANGKGISLPDFLKKKEGLGSKLWDRFSETIETAVISEVPPFPRKVLVELANICNHQCAFCAYPLMTRPSQVIDPNICKDILKQAYDLGAREVGMHGGSEPLACRQLEEHIAACADMGYEYIYFSTNGSLGDETRFKAILDAGLHSIKFSINAGDRETYKKIHGKDHFDKVIRNLKYVSEYRHSVPQQVFLSVSFVELPESASSFSALKKLVDPLVDEVLHTEATNQAGQMLNLPLSPLMPETCQVPFNQVNISREGYLRGCCSDYQNLLALVDLREFSLKDAWEGERFRSFRGRHLRDELGGTICNGCIRGSDEEFRPLHPELGDWGVLKEDARGIIQIGTGES